MRGGTTPGLTKKYDERVSLCFVLNQTNQSFKGQNNSFQESEKLIKSSLNQSFNDYPLFETGKCKPPTITRKAIYKS